MVSDKNAIVVKGLKMSYGDVKVLRGVDFIMPHGSILALLGPNGAGKTTTIKILSTLMPPEAGTARVNGYDVVKESDQVKASIGMTGQFAAVDEYLSGEENLLMIGRLYRLSIADTQRRTTELLKRFDLVEAGQRRVKTYSGGMRRRLDLAMSLIASPPIIFLDEPTTGLDPRSRLTMWDMIKNLARSGTTILLTTQYMEEADRLADRIIVLDNGKIIAEGTVNQLKAKVGTGHVEVTIGERGSLEKAKQLLSAAEDQVDSEKRVISLDSKKAPSFDQILSTLQKASIEVDGIARQRSTLDDVFLTLTGHKVIDEEPAAKPKGKK